MGEYYCPNCGADLNEQLGFDPDNGTWTCTDCGQLLMDDDVYEGDQCEGIAWYCDNCDALLNRQPGFSDSFDTWTCTDCGHVNRITEDDIFESKEDYENSKKNSEWASIIADTISDVLTYAINGDEDDDLINDSSETNTSDFMQEKEPTILKPVIDKGTRKKRFRKNVKRVIFSILIVIILGGAIFCYYEYKHMTEIGYGSEQLQGQNYEKVEKIFGNEGFTNIETKKIEDLQLSDIEQDNLVTSIDLVWNDSFNAGFKYPANFPIVITYHTVMEIDVPITSEEAVGKNYKDVVKAFKHAGFSNIEVKVEYDIITGWLTDVGEVKSVIVDTEDEFDKSSSFHPNSKVVITYHDLRKNK